MRLLVEAVGIELTVMLKARKLLILRIGKMAKHRAFAEARVHGGYTEVATYMYQTSDEPSRLTFPQKAF